MRWVLGAAFALVACGGRTDLGGVTAPNVGDASPEASTRLDCKPGDPMQVLTTFAPNEYNFALQTDGNWIYGDLDTAIWSMGASGGERKTIVSTMSSAVLFAPSGDGVYFEDTDLEWVRHDGSDRHTVLPRVWVVAPPVAYIVPETSPFQLEEDALADGSHHVLATLDGYPDGLSVTNRYVHVLIGATGPQFVDRRIDRGDGSFHDIALGDTACPVTGSVWPNAMCFGEVCALDESDVGVKLPLTNPCPMFIDDEWAYFSKNLPDVTRVDLRNGTVETVLKNAQARSIAEANGCIYVDVSFGSPGSSLVRIPR